MAGEPRAGDKWEPGSRRCRINGEIFCFAVQIMATDPRTLSFVDGSSIL